MRERVRDAVRHAGWRTLEDRLPMDRSKGDFLLAAMLERGRASVRDSSGALVPGVRRMNVRGEMGAGRRFFLPDGKVLLRVTDIVY